MLKRMLQPDWRKLFLFAVLIAIAIGAHIQTWAFVDDMPHPPPKPPLYDLLRPLPLWALWIFLQAPLALLLWPLRLLGLDVMRGDLWWFRVAGIIYFYLLSCLVVAVLDWLKGRLRRQRG
ncbi:MAG TPA: hypothetical protein PLJ35_09065 [Anaerolineae bacterium]|nr:hypothetical protein [Anaerolineae bacterium]HOQ98959.1 hypothetical protein [Anaerolineae bacterium]HPL27605.1 hypothetical protein [Anaerolineae bacterium]